MEKNNEYVNSAVFDIDSIDKAIASGFIDVPVIEDFNAFKAWFESLNTN